MYSKTRLVGVTYVYNEEKMIPYVMPYIERIGYDRFVVYDNGSTDRTVELLKQYPFIEIRTSDTNGVFDDLVKTKSHMEVIEEEHALSLTREGLTFVTITDFDEVLIETTELGFKHALVDCYSMGCSYYAGRMINLIPKKGTEIKNDSGLIHTYSNIMGSWWNNGGEKTTIICINNFSHLEFTTGNHITYGEFIDKDKAKDMDDTGYICGFHLKYIDRAIYDNHLSEYCKRDGSGERYKDFKKNNVYEIVQSSSFPLYLYFYGKGVKRNPYFGMHSKKE